MDDDAYQRLNRIDEQLMELCRWLIDKRDVATASRLMLITDDLTRLVAELGVKRSPQQKGVRK